MNFNNIFQFYSKRKKYHLIKGKRKKLKQNDFIKTDINILFLAKLIILLFFILFIKNSNIFDKNNANINTNINTNINLNMIINTNINISELNFSGKIRNNIFFTVLTNMTFNLTDLEYSYSMRFKVAEIKYNIGFYDGNNNLIAPSNLSFLYNYHIICTIKDINNNEVNSFANIYKNKYYMCIEYFTIKEKIKLGIKIYPSQINNNSLSFYFDTSNIVDYNNLNYNNDYKFNPSYIINEYKTLEKKAKLLQLKNSYIKSPIYKTKIDTNYNNNKWIFENIYNNYFCFCKGTCIFNSYNQMSQKCKYNFYVTIIDNNRNVYNKTDYLFADFFKDGLSADDTYPIFIEMLKQNISAHYLTERKDIYKEYCGYNNKCQIIIKEININGDFLEKYLELILKLKATISGGGFYTMDNLFFNIEYITNIYLGHGLNYFKPFLYEEYMGCKKFNKILASTSNKINSLILKYGWKEENLIKMCQPKWDKYDIYKNKTLFEKNNEKSIMIFFTWRNLKRGSKGSPDYYKNIFNLINNEKLYYELINNNITLYYNIHHMFSGFKGKIKVQKKNINILKYIDIFDCLTKSKLLVSDFSSVIFDMMYQRKPVIMFIPDINDKNINNYYDDEYANMINSLKDGTIYLKIIFLKLKKLWIKLYII